MIKRLCFVLLTMITNVALSFAADNTLYVDIGNSQIHYTIIGSEHDLITEGRINNSEIVNIGSLDNLLNKDIKQYDIKVVKVASVVPLLTDLINSYAANNKIVIENIDYSYFPELSVEKGNKSEYGS